MRVVPASSAAVEEAARVLGADGIVVLPTDTVYGVAVSAARPGAAATLAEVKGRSPDQPVAVLVGSREQAASIAAFDGRARAVAAALWPGPVTLVLDRRPAVDWELGGADTAVGVRWPDDPLVAELARRVGPLAVTSANRHGAPTAATAAEAAADLVGAVDLVIDGGPRAGRSSTVVELADGRWAVLREGGVPTATIAEVLERG